jgi:hypothetical protein
MNKSVIFSSILLVALIIGLCATGSCSNDDDDLPQVDVKVVMSGCEQNADDNRLYITQGKSLTVDSVIITPTNGKETAMGLTTFLLNGIPQFQTAVAPYRSVISTSDLPEGDYLFQIKSAVYQVDKSAAFMMITYHMRVTAPVVNPDSVGGNIDGIGPAIVNPDDMQLSAQ